MEVDSAAEASPATAPTTTIPGGTHEAPRDTSYNTSYRINKYKIITSYRINKYKIITSYRTFYNF